MKLLAIRHTKVDVPAGICYGQSDVGVYETFSGEAKKVKDAINMEPDVVFCSPLKRCRLLAEAVFPEKDICFDDRLKELNFGKWELKSWDEIYASEKGRIWMDNYQTLPTRNGESYPEMTKRINSFLSELKKSTAENVIVFTHAGVIRIMKSILEKQKISELFENYRPDYGNVTEFEM